MSTFSVRTAGRARRRRHLQRIGIGLSAATMLFGSVVALAEAGDASSPGRRANAAATRRAPHTGARRVTHPRKRRHRRTFGSTTTPIKHVIVIIGENHTFDNVFATYSPRRGQHVRDLLSQGIVTSDGQLGANASQAAQNQATNTGAYSISPARTSPYSTLPQPDTTSANGQPQDVPDARFPANLPNGPYQITRYVSYPNAFVGDPLHRFYQMWQEVGTGREDLWTWVHETAGDDNGANPPAKIHQGALDMGYYNVARGDAPVLDFLAKHYAMSDNYHQAVMGGTGANHVAIGTGDAAFYQDGAGNPIAPPGKQIENPNAKPGTNNNYTQDGYSGGTYSNCSDPNQPGVGAVLGYLNSLPYKAFRAGDCQPGAYYLLNNYHPGFNADGTVNTTTYTVPPQRFPTIADPLDARGISWAYYGQGWNGAKPDANYCDICNPFQYSTTVMSNPALRARIQDLAQFNRAAQGGTLPAVSFLKPNGNYDGHPASSSLSLFEQFAGSAINTVMSNPKLASNTAIFVTMDEGGGYYDSGYVQPLSFFGDGTRVPIMAVSPYARVGAIAHSYTDHASLLKFIEHNWRLRPLSNRSLDNLPNPRRGSNPYVPANRPAIGDLMDMFDFSHPRAVAPVPVPQTAVGARVRRWTRPQDWPPPA